MNDTVSILYNQQTDAYNKHLSTQQKCWPLWSMTKLDMMQAMQEACEYIGMYTVRTCYIKKASVTFKGFANNLMHHIKQ